MHHTHHRARFYIGTPSSKLCADYRAYKTFSCTICVHTLSVQFFFMFAMRPVDQLIEWHAPYQLRQKGVLHLHMFRFREKKREMTKCFFKVFILATTTTKKSPSVHHPFIVRAVNHSTFANRTHATHNCTNNFHSHQHFPAEHVT